MRSQDKRLDAFRQRRAVARARGLVCLAVITAATYLVGVSQVPQPNGGLAGPERNSAGMPGLPENANPRPDGVRALRDSMNQQDNFKRMAQLNALRQKQMSTDAEKLIALANEVKAETATTPGSSAKEQLTMAQVRKVEQIERLAHQVRDKMRETVGD